MDLTHVRTLQEIVKQGGFSRAARTLHRSQPAVSHHIRLLEADLGVRLLERVGKRAFPTAAGALVLEHAARAMDALETARQAVQQLRGRVAGRVRLGTGGTFATYVLPDILRGLRRRYPDLELMIVTGNASDIVASVSDNALDVGIVTIDRGLLSDAGVPASGRPAARRSALAGGRHLAVAPFAVDELVAVAAAPATAWRRRPALTPRELAGHPLICYERAGRIRVVIDDWFRRAGVSPRIAMELGNAEAIKRLVEAGLGVGITSAITVKTEARSGRLVALPLAPRLARELATVRRRDKPLDPALQALLAALDASRVKAGHSLALRRRRLT